MSNGRNVPHWLSRVLAHPKLADLDIDDPRTTEVRREIIREKPFLQAIYREWYAMIVARLRPGDGRVLELGSGAGFLSEAMPEVIKSDILPVKEIDLVTDACFLALRDGTLRAIVFTDVLHHIAAPRDFLREAVRVLRPAGRIVMIEPWVTPWSRFVYGRLHHEPFHPENDSWEFPMSGPLSGANGALPWIIFERDRGRFEAEFPSLHLIETRLLMPFRFLLSGGTSNRALIPSWSFGAMKTVEQALGPFLSKLAMFALVVIEKHRSSVQ